jgi:hypothetical protein
MLTGVPSNQVYHNNELRFLNEWGFISLVSSVIFDGITRIK